ncbi:HD domain-containing protein [Halocatena halophila]|uniref:HD domain-containing protein n=1 Tax=Halocatena halophila TaxID=2814576 RepID=UPI002ED64948
MTNNSSQILHRRVQEKRDEVDRALPPLRLIDDGDIYWTTIEVIQSNVPDYFWHAPAASSYKHHNPFCCGERGLWIHTLMVATAYERLVDSYLEQGAISSYERDLGRAAVLLHDLCKYGDAYEDGDRAAKDHDLQAAALVYDSDLDDWVADAIASHMGPWYEGPEPETSLEELVHLADMAASTKNGTFGVYRKPMEISKLYPNLPEAEL